MSNNIHLLYIEDETNLWDGFLKEAEIYGAVPENKIAFVVHCVPGIEEAKAAIATQKFDIIVTDLKIATGIPGSDAVTTGNLFIKELKEISPCPIAILTGKPSDVEDDTLDRSSMAKFTKEVDAETKIFHWIKTKLPLISLMQQSFELLNKELATLFHSGVADRISELGSTIPAESSLRMILENIADRILTVNSTTKSHPQESYIHPVIRNNIMTGDLISIGDETWVILTPACNIVRYSKNEIVLLAKCNDHPKYRQYLDAAEKGDDKSLRALINQANNLFTHFLPPLNKGEAPKIVNFDELITIKYSELDPNNIIAAISPKFLPNLIHRFSAYIGRPGAPDIEPSHCLQHSL
ncbi:DNA-binding transcriptional response regulator [Pseudomonas lini]|uniref:Response regulator n=1 Tax=Pseudomonas lini TaxID=163011 RepID=A0A0J6HIA9_9PSED|nr:response regulator [Pseudomonas lini]KAB0506063.1 response regulator [Pseudomonas lini]KMM94193.1 hypothetical protein TU81_06535 [Pseudomonas lini]SDT63046.1 hypothetical protein SAMN04490191_5685 [Pseudomonas lini]